MSKASFYDIKADARSAMKGHMGEVILAGLILPIALGMIANFFTGFLDLFVFAGSSYFLSTFVSAITTYITIRMVIKISRYKSDTIFNGFFGTIKGKLSALGWGLILLLVSVVYIIIYWEYVVYAWDMFEIIQSEAYFSNPEILEHYILNTTIVEPSITLILISVVYSIIVIIFSIRFSFALYIIGDTDEGLIVALRKSWLITRGNWWRIFFFPLSFILWIFAIMFTFGLAVLYVTPYIAVSQASLYNRLLSESGIEFDDGVARKTVDLTDEEALDEKDNKFDNNDPFESYYK